MTVLRGSEGRCRFMWAVDDRGEGVDGVDEADEGDEGAGIKWVTG